MIRFRSSVSESGVRANDADGAGRTVRRLIECFVFGSIDLDLFLVELNEAAGVGRLSLRVQNETANISILTPSPRWNGNLGY